MGPVNSDSEDNKDSNKRNGIELFSQNEEENDAYDGDAKSDPVELFECLFDYF